MRDNYKVKLSNVLNKYGYFIYEIEYLDKLKTVYIANKDTKVVSAVFTDKTWLNLSERISYSLAMSGSV